MKIPFPTLAIVLIALLFLAACAPRGQRAPTQQESQTMREALEAYSAGKCKQSIDLFSILASSSPHPAVYNGLGMAQLQCAQNLQAVESFKRALSMAPASTAIQANLGAAYFAAGNLRAADSAFESVLRADPSNPEALLGKASVLLERGDADKALKLMKQLPPDIQQSGEALYDRGLILYKLGLYDDAESALRAYLVQNGADAGVCNALAISLLGQHKYNEALEEIDRAIGLDPMEARYYYNRGNIYKAKKDFSKAIEDYGRAIAFEPEFAEAFVNRGDLLYLQNSQSQGCADLEQACKLGKCERLDYFRDMGRCMSGIWK